MLKRAHIKTRLVSTTEDGEDTIRTECHGTCQSEDGSVLLRYKEERSETQTALLLTAALADLKRRGAVEMRMTFIDGRMLPCAYRTAEGTADLSLYTHTQAYAFDGQRGRFVARYALLVSGRHATDNQLTVEWEVEE